MQLGFVTAILPDLSLEDVLSFARDTGYDVVEVMCWPAGQSDRKYGGVTHLDVAGMTQARADDTLALCQHYGVGLSGLGYYPNPLSQDADEAELAQQHLRRVIEAAPLLQLDVVNTFVGADHTQPADVNLARFAEIWPDLVRYAEDRGVRLAIENCPMLFGDRWPFGTNLARSPEIWRAMFSTIQSDYFGLNLDPSHLVMQLMDTIQPIFDFGPKIFHTHAKDMRIDRRRLDDVGCIHSAYIGGWGIPKIPGLGDVDWQRWISALTDVGYHGPVCVEVEDDAFTETLEDRQRSLKISHDVLRPLIG